MKGSPMKRNFNIGASPLSKRTYAEAKKADPSLDSYISERKKYDAGSSEYEELQAKINAAYGTKRSQKLKAAQVRKVEKRKAEETYDPSTDPSLLPEVEVKAKQPRKKGRLERWTDSIVARQAAITRLAESTGMSRREARRALKETMKSVKKA